MKNKIEKQEEKVEKPQLVSEITEEDIQKTMEEYGLSHEEAEMATKMGW